MRTGGRVEEVRASTDVLWDAAMFMECAFRSEIAGGAQTLECVLGFVVHGAPGALRGIGRFKLGDDVVEGRRLRRDRRGDVGVAKRAISLAVVREIQGDDRDAFAARVGPDVE